ncbi:hypothetical protein V6Z11_A01G101800 [Gossypium hirsutum]
MGAGHRPTVAGASHRGKGVSGVGGARDGQRQRGHTAELWWLHLGEGFAAERCFSFWDSILNWARLLG